MKKNLLFKIALTWILVFTIIYLMAAFVSLKFNPTEWDVIARFVYVSMSFGVSSILTGAVSEAHS